MTELDELRRQLDRTDREIVRIFEERLATVRRIAAYKGGAGLPVRDPEREAHVLETRAAMLEDPQYAAEVRLLFEAIMGISREMEERLIRENSHA